MGLQKRDELLDKSIRSTFARHCVLAKPEGGGLQSRVLLFGEGARPRRARDNGESLRGSKPSKQGRVSSQYQQCSSGTDEHLIPNHSTILTAIKKRATDNVLHREQEMIQSFNTDILSPLFLLLLSEGWQLPRGLSFVISYNVCMFFILLWNDGSLCTVRHHTLWHFAPPS